MKKYSVVEILYKEYDKFFSFALSLLKNRSLAQDVVQDVFLQLMTSNSNHLIHIYGAGSGVSYVNKIIAVRCLSKKSQFYKQQLSYERNKVKVSEQELEYICNPIFNTSIPINKLLFAKIEKAISTFDEYEKNLFMLYYESGMTYGELSKQIGIPKLSIYNSVRKVRKQIKKLV